MFGFLDVPVSGAFHLVTILADLLDPLFGALATATAIVAFTACVRLLLHPLSRAAVRGELARSALAPQAKQLRDRHREDPQRLQQELSALYRAEGTSLFAGCLPMLVQLPFFSVMYRLFSSPSVGGTPNALLGHTLFGAPLGAHWLTVATTWSGAVFVGLFAALAAVAWCSMRWQARQAPDTGAVPGGKLLRLLPFGTVLAAAVLPLAAGLYLLTTTTWTLVERAALRRRATAAARRPRAGGGAPGRTS
ncbi:YidC/Oxa1 family membrane protein insertase [Solihabitans fulvus]|uniref:Membrane protein insertase YidC n=1 Tax=Solihabitans fulvus TaxID=1892852 RepID=A0A5B2XDY7_9PSEU|nr:membrane protein insertase YidC [Solihabitans fulvus]KAA2261364.1 YidC/Oxa1 family membrane protein insertase [Solihabitans fulvus]